MRNYGPFIKLAFASAATILLASGTAHAAGHVNPQTPGIVDTETARKNSLVIVGDSIGFGASGYGKDAKTTAVVGQPLPQITKQLNGLSPGTQIVVFGGTNDANDNASFSEANLEKRVQQFLDAARNRQIRIVGWVGPPEVVPESSYDKNNPAFASNLETAHETLQKIMKEKGIPYISLRDGLVTRQGDGLHPSKKDSQNILKEVLKLGTPTLQQKQNMEKNPKAQNQTLPKTRPRPF